MKVCIVGNGLVGLTLAKALVNEGVFVDLISNQKINKTDKLRTLGISRSNTEYLSKNIIDIKKYLWEINKIEIYSDNLKDEKILNFEDSNKTLFSIVKNHELYDCLITSLNKSIFFKKKKEDKKLLNKNYKLIINCDENSFLTKKYFNKRFNKKYNSYAHTTIIDHKKISNNVAIQIFTKKGPLAFLPISDKKTSVVYSARGTKNIDLENLIKKYNFKYSIIKINQISSIELIANDLRNYHFNNIIAFGDLLHKLHPLAGQGYNMSIRDIKFLMDLIKFKLNLGIEIDISVCKDFEKNIKHKNFLFSNGIDFIYEFFNLESKLNNSFLTKSIRFFGRNKYANKFFTKFADNGTIGI